VKISCTSTSVFVDLDFFEDDAALALNVRVGEGWIEDQIAEHVEGDGHVVRKRFDAEADGLLAGEGVEIAADGVHFAGNVLRRAGLGALEEHVLDKVRDAVDLRGLIARAGFDPDAHGDRAQMLHAFGEDDEAVGEHGAAQVADGGGVSRGFSRHSSLVDCKLRRRLRVCAGILQDRLIFWESGAD
jgi:hypothetical protein